MDETRARKIAAVFQFLLGLYAVAAFIVTGNLFNAFWAVGLGLTSLLMWFDPSVSDIAEWINTNLAKSWSVPPVRSTHFTFFLTQHVEEGGREPFYDRLDTVKTWEQRPFQSFLQRHRRHD